MRQSKRDGKRESDDRRCVPDLANSVRQMQPMAGQTIVEIIQAEGTENVKTFAACSGYSSVGKCESTETALTNG